MAVICKDVNGNIIDDILNDLEWYEIYSEEVQDDIVIYFGHRTEEEIARHIEISNREIFVSNGYNIQISQDEALTSLYESMLEQQLEQDDAITSLYELIIQRG